MSQRSLLAITGLIVSLAAANARAQAPSVQELAGALGLSAADVASAQAGSLVPGEAKPSNERELTATLLFVVQGLTPTQLVGLSDQALLDRSDANTLRFGDVPAGGGADAFAKLELGAEQSQVWAAAAPGETLNVSSAEIAALGSASAIEPAVRELLAQRVASYRAQGLAGIAPYARKDGATRPAGDDLRSATRASAALQKYAPNAYRALLDYPSTPVAGTKDLVRWSQISAHDVPTIALTQMLYIPDGEAWVVAQRQFYVSTGYNCEQALAALLPVEGGTLVLYVNRTSSDQVTGWGGAMKRDLGSRILASSLRELFEKARAAAKAAR